MDCVNTEYQIKHSTTQTLHACMYTESSSYSGSYLSFSPAPGPPCCFADNGEGKAFYKEYQSAKDTHSVRELFLSGPCILQFCLCLSFRIINIRYTTILIVTKQWYTSNYVCDHLMSWNKYHQTFKKRRIYICLTKISYKTLVLIYHHFPPDLSVKHTSSKVVLC